MKTPETACHWANRKNWQLISAGFTILVGKIDGLKEEFNADRKQDKMSTLIDGLQKSVNPTIVQQLKGKKLVVSTGNLSLATMLTGLPADDLLNKYPLPQELKDMVKNYQPKTKPQSNTVNAFAIAFGGNKTPAQPNAPVPAQQAYTVEQEDMYIALAAKDLFKQIAGHLEPIMEKQGQKENEVTWVFKVVDKPQFQEVAASLFRGGETNNEDGSMIVTYGLLKTITN